MSNFVHFLLLSASACAPGWGAVTNLFFTIKDFVQFFQDCQLAWWSALKAFCISSPVVDVDITSSPVVDVDIREDDGRRSLTFVTRRKHFAFRLVKSVLTLNKVNVNVNATSCTHRRWLKRIGPAKYRVPRGNQLLEISLEHVQIWAIVERLREWNVSGEVFEDRLFFIDWLCLAPVVVNVRLEWSRLDAGGDREMVLLIYIESNRSQAQSKIS